MTSFLNIDYLTKGLYFIKNKTGLNIIEDKYSEIDIEKKIEEKKDIYLNTSQSFNNANSSFTQLNKCEKTV